MFLGWVSQGFPEKQQKYIYIYLDVDIFRCIYI